MANTLTFANLTLTDENIFGGISYLVDLNTGDEFSIGNTASACVSFTTDTQVPIYTKDNVNGVFVWDIDGTDKGRFYITEAKKNGNKYDVTAYDAMLLLGTSVSALSLTLPVSVSAAASAIASHIGCTVSGTIINGSLTASEFPEDMTIRALLGRVAEASGCSVKIDGSDHLCFMYYADSGITITQSQYKEGGLAVADYTCAAIDNVTIVNNQGEIQATAGSGTNSLFIGQNPFLEEATNTNATNIYNAVKNFAYAPLTCELFAEEGLEVGTIATFGTTPTLVMHIESSESGAVASSVGSDSRSEYNKDIMVTLNETREIAIDAQTVAGLAQTAAAAASSAAASAQSSADAASASASAASAQASAAASAASAASTAAGNAQSSANAAQASANNANEYAARALGDLGAVQSVAETFAWITQHGTMTLTTDTTPDPSHVYFVVDANGDYVVGNTHYSVVPLPDASQMSNYYELSIDQSLNNYVATHLVVDSDGLWIIPDSGGNRVLISVGAQGAYSTPGTYIVGKVNGVDTIFARFTANGATMQAENGTQIAHFGYGLGNAQSGTAMAPYYTLGIRSAGSDVGNYSVAEGLGTIASGYVSHAEGRNTIASGYGSHAEGQPSGHAGVTYNTTASGGGSHAEGLGTLASGAGSHAEGAETEASGYYSHAEGDYSKASGNVSHAGGYETIASRFSQTVVGRYNVQDGSNPASYGTYAVIIGNGTDSNRSNALAVKWNGDLRIEGDLYTNCDADSSNGKLMKLLKVSKSSVSSLNTTISHSAITANMECIHCVLSNPSAQTGDWTVTTSAGSAVISGSISGTTDITLYLSEPST